MKCCPCPCKDDIRAYALASGATACGFAEAAVVAPEAIDIYDNWILHGYHGDMHYCERYREVRNDPRLLLDGARTVMVCAFNYYNETPALPLAPLVAHYAWGADYHWVVKSKLNAIGEYICREYGGSYRACVDTAPIRERYWAQQAGIGFIGINNQLIVPGVGSWCFIGILLLTIAVEPDSPCTLSCDGCRRCVAACPGQALDGNGGCDASRCHSYLTIEHRGELSTDCHLGTNLYGCDVCQRVCPHNGQAKPTRIAEFLPDASILSHTPASLSTLTSSQWRRMTRHSAMNRITLPQLLRNLEHLEHEL